VKYVSRADIDAGRLKLMEGRSDMPDYVACAAYEARNVPNNPEVWRKLYENGFRLRTIGDVPYWIKLPE